MTKASAWFVTFLTFSQIVRALVPARDALLLRPLPTEEPRGAAEEAFDAEDTASPASPVVSIVSVAVATSSTSHATALDMHASPVKRVIPVTTMTSSTTSAPVPDDDALPTNATMTRFECPGPLPTKCYEEWHDDHPDYIAEECAPGALVEYCQWMPRESYTIPVATTTFSALEAYPTCVTAWPPPECSFDFGKHGHHRHHGHHKYPVKWPHGGEGSVELDFGTKPAYCNDEVLYRQICYLWDEPAMVKLIEEEPTRHGDDDFARSWEYPEGDWSDYLGFPHASCDVSYQVSHEKVYIAGANWDTSRLGINGTNLHHELKHCSPPVHWTWVNFTKQTGKFPWQYTLSFTTIIGQRHCIERALMRAGAPQIRCDHHNGKGVLGWMGVIVSIALFFVPFGEGGSVMVDALATVIPATANALKAAIAGAVETVDGSVMATVDGAITLVDRTASEMIGSGGGLLSTIPEVDGASEAGAELVGNVVKTPAEMAAGEGADTALAGSTNAAAKAVRFEEVRAASGATQRGIPLEKFAPLNRATGPADDLTAAQQAMAMGTFAGLAGVVGTLPLWLNHGKGRTRGKERRHDA